MVGHQPRAVYQRLISPFLCYFWNNQIMKTSPVKISKHPKKGVKKADLQAFIHLLMNY